MSTMHNLDQRDMSVRVEAGHVVLVRWHELQGNRVPMDVARLSLKELGLLVCFSSEGWAGLCLDDQYLRAAAVAAIIGGCLPALLPPRPPRPAEPTS